MKIENVETFIVGNPPPHFGGKYFILIKLTSNNIIHTRSGDKYEEKVLKKINGKWLINWNYYCIDTNETQKLILKSELVLLPVFEFVKKEYRKKGKNKDVIPVVQFRKECREFAEKWIEIQKKEFRRLGVEGDWETP